jgi:hypothetical protein
VTGWCRRNKSAQADLLPSLGAPLWDTSDVLPQTTAVGTLLHALIGYNAQPASTQIVFYVVTLLAIAAGMRWAAPRIAQGAKSLTPASASKNMVPPPAQQPRHGETATSISGSA